MKPTEEQQRMIAGWVADGAGISEVQTRLAAEFGIRMNYMDTRFLLLEIGATLKDKPAPEEPAAAPAPETAPDGADEDYSEADGGGFDDEEEAAAPGAAAKVSVEISPITRPGLALAGSVVFSDGAKAEWGITRDGRFALDTGNPAYKPAAEDLRAFQEELRRQMERQGY